MTEIFRNKSLFLPLWLLLIVAGCAAPMTLESKSAGVPVGVDLSGAWTLRDDPANRRITNALPGGGRLLPTRREQRVQRSGRSSGPSVQVFLEHGESLKITQTDFGIFIAYDRSIVEEFSFGENRPVAIGPIEAHRVSGWQGNAFITETIDRTGTVLQELWHLENQGQELVRSIQIYNKNAQTFKLVQRFDRT